jgi:AraC-like DNA-binding protein
MPHYTWWTVLLIAFASQCIFLITVFVLKPGPNKRAENILLFLLAIIFLVNLSNLLSATYFYRHVPLLAGFARGMVLLLGPCLYFYTLAVLKHEFRFRKSHLVHFMPYLIAFILIRIQESSVSRGIIIAAIDNLMQGKVIMDLAATSWFIIYCLHLLIYVAATRRMVAASVSIPARYLIPVSLRITLLKRLSGVFVLITLVFTGIIAYILYNGTYTIMGNFYYTIVLAALVYVIATQAITDRKLLSPGFERKYASARASDKEIKDVLHALEQLFTQEKIFTNPDLKIGTLAEKIGVNAVNLSHVINAHYNKSFTDVVNEYRVKEFISRATQPGYSGYSLFGIASEVGYRNKSSFNLAFKKQTGATPSEYLKSLACC